MQQMKLKNLALCALMAITAILTGCSGSPDPIVQNKEAIDNVKAMRAYYDSSKGDYSALSPTDQAAAKKLVNGSGADVQKEFDFFKTANKTGTPKQQ